MIFLDGEKIWLVEGRLRDYNKGCIYSCTLTCIMPIVEVIYLFI